MHDVKKYLEKLVSFKSVSAKNECHEELVRCAEALKSMLLELGMEKVETWLTKTNVPTVFAEHRGKEGSKTLLIYNHYDVQPEEPLELWQTDPFILTEKEGHLYARGAEDNKGQLACVLAALSGGLPSNLHIKLLIEGEEEIGSRGLYPLVKEKQAFLKADYLLIFDTGMTSIDKGAITCGTRGIQCFDLEVTTGSYDLHSGMYGGIARSAPLELTHLLTKLIGPNGEILVPNFFEDVVSLSSSVLKQLTFHSNEDEVYSRLQRSDTTDMERNWLLPTLEINGIIGGYTGTGSKTIIPAKAMAKLSIRLVANQEGPKLMALIEKYLEAVKSPGVTLKLTDHGGGDPSFSEPTSFFVQTCKKVFASICKDGCDLAFDGASIPITATLQKCSGAEVALAGIGLKEDRIHSPNENISPKQLDLGVRFIRQLLIGLS